ncbi:MAG TPA: hypothetical protein HA362_06220 [Nanoarchaeota archaeon]|nr:hypothetical protein [Nanoarchaeota archaeon]
MVIGKQGYIKTLEAVIAIVIILIFTFAVTPKPEPSYGLPSSVENAQNYIMEEIGLNNELRTLIMDAVVANPEDPAYIEIGQIASDNMPAGYGYSIGICLQSACATNSTPIADGRSIYTAESMISSGNSSDTTPRVVRLWMWRL